MPISDETLWELCREKSFRYQLAFVVMARGLSRQIREMRRARGWTQKELARRADLSVVSIVRMEIWAGNAAIRSLHRIAAACDVALIVRFVSWGEFFLTLGQPLGAPLSFDEEDAAIRDRDKESRVVTGDRPADCRSAESHCGMASDAGERPAPATLAEGQS